MAAIRAKYPIYQCHLTARPGNFGSLPNQSLHVTKRNNPVSA